MLKNKQITGYYLSSTRILYTQSNHENCYLSFSDKNKLPGRLDFLPGFFWIRGYVYTFGKIYNTMI